MKEEISNQSVLDSLSGDAIHAKCTICGETEWVIGMNADFPIDEIFLSNYYCDDCDQLADDKSDV